MTQDTRFLRACRREPVDCTPVWFMRQAGRYMKEYRELRARHSLLELCRTPELAAQITLQPVKKLGVDAAIIFADLLLPAQAMGMKLDFVEGEGPMLSDPVRSFAAVRSLRAASDGELRYVGDAVRLVHSELKGRIPIIGFCGAPFTLASYMIEGGPSRDFALTKKMMYAEPELWRELLEKLVNVLIQYAVNQVDAGAAAVQVFDSWVGCLSPADYRCYVLPHSERLIRGISERRIPVIHFGTGTVALLSLMREAGGDVIGLDWRVDLDAGWKQVGFDVAVQGNLDPIVLMSAPLQVIRQQVDRIMLSARGRAGHIFNLGHGILPSTPVENVQAVVEMVHTHRATTTAPSL